MARAHEAVKTHMRTFRTASPLPTTGRTFMWAYGSDWPLADRRVPG